MKKSVALILILFCCMFALASCGDKTVSPYKPQTTPNNIGKTFTVYVCGAVEREGYYTATEGQTIADIVALAGFNAQTYITEDMSLFVLQDLQICVGYIQDNKIFPAVNLNGAHVQFNLPMDNVSDAVLQKLHDYYVQKGKFTNKNILKFLLTEEEYQQNYYKFFVSEEYYEAD